MESKNLIAKEQFNLMKETAYLINVSANKTRKLENLVWKSKHLTIFIQSISTRKSAVMNAFYLCFEKKVLPLYAVILITH